MGIDYSITVGYGFTVEEDDLPDFVKGDEDYVDSWEIQKWLDANGYENIRCEEVGNYMSGETLVFFCLEDSYFHTGSREFDGVHDLSMEPVPEGKSILSQLAANIDCTNTIGWKVAGNVS